MQIWATGTMNVGGQPCKLANYLAALRYATPGRQKVPVPAMRVDFACVGANGRPGPHLALTLLLSWLQVVVALAGAFLIVNQRAAREA